MKLLLLNIFYKFTGEIRFLVVVSLIVYFIFRFKPPKKIFPVPIDKSMIDPMILSALNKYDDDFKNLKYTETGVFESKGAKNTMTFKCFISNDLKTEVMVIIGSDDGKKINTQIVEFCSILSPHGNISTSNIPFPDSFVHLSDQIRTKLPGINNVAELHEIHNKILSYADNTGYKHVLLKKEELAQRMKNNIDNEYNIQIKMGRMKINSKNEYVFTPKGFLIGPCLVIFQYFHYLIWSFFTPSPERQINNTKKKIKKLSSKNKGTLLK